MNRRRETTYKYIIWQVGKAAGCRKGGKDRAGFPKKKGELSTGCLVLGGGRLILDTVGAEASWACCIWGAIGRLFQLEFRVGLGTRSRGQITGTCGSGW